MGIPAATAIWAEPFDPSDRDWAIVQFDDLLVEGDKIDTVSIALLPEAVALGLTIIEDAEHGPAILNDLAVEIWFEIDEAMHSNAAFVAGVLLPLEISIETDATPPRHFQRTVALRVIQL